MVVFHSVLYKIFSKKASLYIRGHDSEDTVGGVIIVVEITLKPQQKMGNVYANNFFLK